MEMFILFQGTVVQDEALNHDTSSLMYITTIAAVDRNTDYALLLIIPKAFTQLLVGIIGRDDKINQSSIGDRQQQWHYCNTILTGYKYLVWFKASVVCLLVSTIRFGVTRRVQSLTGRQKVCCLLSICMYRHYEINCQSLLCSYAVLISPCD